MTRVSIKVTRNMGFGKRPKAKQVACLAPRATSVVIQECSIVGIMSVLVALTAVAVGALFDSMLRQEPETFI